jgi:hypothetical protein
MRERNGPRRQMIRALGPEHSVRLQWVQKILGDCFLASARLSAEQRRVGRAILSFPTALVIGERPAAEGKRTLMASCVLRSA